MTNSSSSLGIVDQHLHHEAVDLRLGQRVGAFGLDGVLRGHHQEGRGHLVGLAGNRHLALLHHLEQRALHLGRGAVDLVGQQQVGKHRAERGGEFARLGMEDARADQVGRHQVGGELDALEAAAQRLRQRLDGERLGQAGHPFHQQVATGQHGDHHAFEKVVLPHHHPLDLVEQLLHQGGGGAGVAAERCASRGGGRGVGGFSHAQGLRSGGSERRHARTGGGVLDRHGKTDADEGACPRGVEDGGDDAHHRAVVGDQRAARVARGWPRRRTGSGW